MKVKGLELLLDDGPCFVFIGCLVLAINVIRGLFIYIYVVLKYVLPFGVK